MNWYLVVLKKYAEFQGRSRRSEFWMFALFNLIISVVLSVIEGVIGISGVFSGLYSLAVLVPGIAVSVRRLHDTNRPGLWVLIGLIPLVGAIILLVFMAQDSDSGENQYGPNPK